MSEITCQITQNVIEITMDKGLPAGYFDTRFYLKYEYEADTTDATPTEMLIDSARLTVGADEVWLFTIAVVGVDSSTRDTKTWLFEGAIKRDASNNTSIVGTVNKEVPSADVGASAWDCDVSADDTNEALKVLVTGEAAHSIKWKASAMITKISL